MSKLGREAGGLGEYSDEASNESQPDGNENELTEDEDQAELEDLAESEDEPA